MLQTEDLFYALDGPAKILKHGIYRVKTWRSTNNLKTIEQEEAVIRVPEGPAVHYENDRWNGIFVYRTIIEMPDGSWLATMYGNFASDTIPPKGRDAMEETKFMMRTFIITSADKGCTWNYLSTVAAPHSGDPVGEGFVEPAITLLNDGRLLCVMRTGHHFPLYSSWSSDGGKTWTPPALYRT
ncbi:MAG: sialidase family protein [Mangrovibacterium sp.]